jgi:hypothetical protein
VNLFVVRYGFLTHREHELRLFEKRPMRGIFVMKFRRSKSGAVRWAKNVAHKKDMLFNDAISTGQGRDEKCIEIFGRKKWIEQIICGTWTWRKNYVEKGLKEIRMYGLCVYTGLIRLGRASNDRLQWA